MALVIGSMELKEGARRYEWSGGRKEGMCLCHAKTLEGAVGWVGNSRDGWMVDWQWVSEWVRVLISSTNHRTWSGLPGLVCLA